MAGLFFCSLSESIQQLPVGDEFYPFRFCRRFEQLLQLPVASGRRPVVQLCRRAKASIRARIAAEKAKAAEAAAKETAAKETK